MKLFVFVYICNILINVDLYPTELIDQELNDHWKIFVNRFNKKYDSNIEELIRRAIWENNLQIIQKHNIEYDLGRQSYSMGLNRFSDMSQEEFHSVYLNNNFTIPNNPKNYYLASLNSNQLPKFVDWRLKGYVTNVKDQGNCGSCWAFSTTGSLEGQHYRKYNSLVNISEQQLVDCSSDDNGCNGGMVDKAVYYIASNGGIESEDLYPYVAVKNKCNFDKRKIVATAVSYRHIRRTERDLEIAVANNGPISIAIDARGIQNYRGGVYINSICSSIYINHALLIVGYGTTNTGIQYWIVKNSWGSSWGEHGYIRMAKNRNNQCGIASYAGFPIV